jgi:hypothetical protein
MKERTGMAPQRKAETTQRGPRRVRRQHLDGGLVFAVQCVCSRSVSAVEIISAVEIFRGRVKAGMCVTCVRNWNRRHFVVCGLKGAPVLRSYSLCMAVGLPQLDCAWSNDF